MSFAMDKEVSRSHFVFTVTNRFLNNHTIYLAMHVDTLYCPSIKSKQG